MSAERGKRHRTSPNSSEARRAGSGRDIGSWNCQPDTDYYYTFHVWPADKVYPDRSCDDEHTEHEDDWAALIRLAPRMLRFLMRLGRLGPSQATFHTCGAGGMPKDHCSGCQTEEELMAILQEAPK